MKKTPFSHWLRGSRNNLKLSQEALGDRIGADRTYISKVENGSIGMPDPKTREKLHKVFGTSDDDLVRAGILERIDTHGFAPSYVPSARGATPLRIVEETDARYDEVDPRTRLRLRAESLTEEQASAILGLLDAFDAS